MPRASCGDNKHHTMRSPHGYIAGLPTELEGAEHPPCSLLFRVHPGQRLDLTFIDFDACSLQSDLDDELGGDWGKILVAIVERGS